MEVRMDEIKKLTLPKQLLAGGGVVVFLFSFFSWFSFELGGYAGFAGIDTSVNGWDVGFLWGGLPAIAGLAAALIVLLPVFKVALPDGAPWELIASICGCIGALVVLKLLTGETGFDRAFGLYIAAIGGAAMCAGGVMSLMNQNKQ